MVGVREEADESDPQPGWTAMNKYDGTTFEMLVNSGTIKRPKPEDIAAKWGSNWLGGINDARGLPACEAT